jgi:hypothetical protein
VHREPVVVLEAQGVLAGGELKRGGLEELRAARCALVQDQLAVDVQEHRQHPDCRTLVCFVYDPDLRITKPHETEAALSGERDGMKVRVLISPKSL